MGDIGIDLARALERAAHRRRCTSVPPESTMSSTRTQDMPSTSPMMFITSDSPARSRRLSTMASGAPRRLANGARPDDAADVGRDRRRVVVGELFLDVAHHDGSGKEIIGRNVEEALDLPGVKIERQHAVGTGTGDEIGDELG